MGSAFALRESLTIIAKRRLAKGREFKLCRFPKDWLQDLEFFGVVGDVLVLQLIAIILWGMFSWLKLS